MTLIRTPAAPRAPSPRQRRALQQLGATARAGERARMTQLATAAHYSPSRLRVLVRDLLGEAPAPRLRRLRLDAVACMLLAQERSLARAARAAGFRSIEAFHRAFRARYGCTPRAWARDPSSTTSRSRAFGIGVALVRHFHTPEASHHG